MSRWIGLAFALLLLAASAGPARAGYYQFGAEDRITKIVDLTVRGAAIALWYLPLHARGLDEVIEGEKLAPINDLM